MTVSRDSEQLEEMNKLLEEARNKPYKIGEHDCALFVTDIMRVFSGRDYSKAFRGKYKTQTGALKLIKRLSGGEESLREAATNVFGIDPLKPAWAMRGSPVLYKEDGQEHLGVSTGTHAAVLHEDGLKFIPLSDCECCWNI